MPQKGVSELCFVNTAGPSWRTPLPYYFNRQSWYVPVEGLNASTFDTSVFNAYEQANLETILAYEREMGWRA
nr:YARHG domain-containing protein [uncultured Flavonifractor sp.]